MISDSILMRPDEWIQRRFTAASAPTVRTVRKWIRDGDVPGKAIGGITFVEVGDELRATGDPTVDRILAEVAREQAAADGA